MCSCRTLVSGVDGVESDLGVVDAGFAHAGEWGLTADVAQPVGRGSDLGVFVHASCEPPPYIEQSQH